MSTAAPPSRTELADLVTRHIDGSDLRTALLTCQQLNTRHPDYAYGWYLASFLMKKGRNYVDALKAIDRALQLENKDRYQFHKARCQFEAGDLAGATATAGLIRDQSFDDADLHSEVGTLLYQVGDYPAALRHYSQAIALAPDNAAFHFNKAAVQRYLGDAAGAEDSFDTAIALQPDEFEAYNGRAQLRTQTRERNHIEQLKSVIAATRSPTGLTQLHYALAKEQEDVGDFPGAFESLRQGADQRRQGMQYSVATDLQIIDKIREVYGAGFFDGSIPGYDSPAPIFVLGMPRTGTTLVERILGSHSTVYSAGELNNFSMELLRLVKETGKPAPASRTDFVAATASLDFRALGAAYIRSTQALRDASPHFVDKLPFNYLYAGLIHLALPKAKIICLERHPMDTCYSVYKQLFKDAYPFSYSLAELGQYYIAYRRLMQHWAEVMPGVIYTLHYEALVADLEGESRRLLDYCGLPWEEQCLRYYENAQVSTTASAIQVRKPVYASSVGKWRNYAAQLEPLRRQLESAGIDTT